MLFLYVQEILELEQICAAMYETSDSSVRQQAEKVLVQFVNDPLVLEKCQLLLQRAVVRTKYCLCV